MKKVIIAGGRDFNDFSRLDNNCSIILEFQPGYMGQPEAQTTIISGGARGADRLGEKFAKEHKCELQVFPADWDTHGKSAGYIRNEQMAQNADCLIAFWDGESKGTRNMIDMALKYRLETHVIFYNNDKD